MHLERKTSLKAEWYGLIDASGTINEIQDKNSINLRNGNNFKLQWTNAETNSPTTLCHYHQIFGTSPNTRRAKKV
jgi:hypothetical protein